MTEHRPTDATPDRPGSPRRDAEPVAAPPAPPRGPFNPWWLPLAVAGLLGILFAVAAVVHLDYRPVEPGFDSPEAIAALLAERGAPCRGLDDEDDGHAEERAVCRVDGEAVAIATYGSRAGVEQQWEREFGAAAENETVSMVIGPTWTISGDARAYLRQAAEVLDVEYRTN